jgi:hypothetical protein
MGKTTTGGNDQLLATMHQILSEQTPDFVEFDQFKIEMEKPETRQWAYGKVKELFPTTMDLSYEDFNKTFEKKKPVESAPVDSGSSEKSTESKLPLSTTNKETVLDYVKPGKTSGNPLILDSKPAETYDIKTGEDEKEKKRREDVETGLRARLTISQNLQKANEKNEDGSMLIYEQSRENSMNFAMNQYLEQLNEQHDGLLKVKQQYESFVGNSQYNQQEVQAGLKEIQALLDGWDKYRSTEMLKFGMEMSSSSADKAIQQKRAQLAAAKPYWDKIKALEIEANKARIARGLGGDKSIEETIRVLEKEKNDAFFSMVANTTNNIVFYDTNEYKPTILMHPSPDDFLKFMLSSVRGQEYSDANWDTIRNGSADEQRIFWAKIEDEFSRQYVEHNDLVSMLNKQGMQDIAEMFTVSKGTHAAGEVKKGALDVISKTLKGGAIQQAGTFNLFMTPRYASEYLQMTTKADSDFMARAKATGMPKEIYNDWYNEKLQKFGEDGVAVMGIKSYEQLHTSPVEEMLLYQVGEGIDDWISGKVKTNPRWKDNWWLSTLPNGTGSMVGFMAVTTPAMLMGENVGTAVLTTLGSLQMIGTTYDDAISNGASYEQAMAAALSPLNIVAGASEAIPLSSFFNRLAKAVPLETALYSFLSRAGVQSLEEGGQEFFQSVANNMTAREYYDFSRDIMEGVKESTTVGLLLGGIMGAMSIRTNDMNFTNEDLKLIDEANKAIKVWASTPEMKELIPDIPNRAPIAEAEVKPVDPIEPEPADSAAEKLQALKDKLRQAESTTQSEIEAKRVETESKIKRKDLFSDGGVFENELGGSGVNSVPTNHSERSGIEFIQFSNPNTGIVDVIMTGKSDNDFVGYYRIYENGKATNKWSSKFENQSRNKEDFKTMISGVQEMLPQGHEYTEKTSISTDGLRVWNQQLSRGYELQYDSKGNLITNRVAINGDAINNELGIAVNKGNFENVSVTNNTDMKKVKEALLPYLQKFGLNESNIHFENGTVEIDLPILKNKKSEQSLKEQTVKQEIKKENEAKKADIERRRPTSYIRDSKDKKSSLETFRNEAKREWDGVSVITGDRMKNLYVGIQLFAEAYPEYKELLNKFIKKENGTIGITNNNLSFVLNTLKKQGVTTESELGSKINAKYDAELAALENTSNTNSQEETNDQQTSSFVDSNPEFFNSINQEAQTLSEEDSLNNLKNNSCKS